MEIPKILPIAKPMAYRQNENINTQNESKTSTNKINESGAGCKTCASRSYQDQSGESVSFKNGGKISADAAPAVVSAHEGEHVSNAKMKAEKEGGEAISSVRLQTSICPECKRVYVSGGVTETSMLKGASAYSDMENSFNGGAGKGDVLSLLA